MRPTTPQVHLICRPQLDPQAVYNYLQSVDGLNWYNRTFPATRVNADGSIGGRAPLMSQGETLIEFAAKLCYRSWAPGLNPNTRKVTEDSQAYLTKILESGHGSVLEHANYTFVFQDVSRVFTHELVRHRAGVAISQESLRYVRLTDLGFRIPEILQTRRNTDTEYVMRDGTRQMGRTLDHQIIHLVETLEDFQRDAAAFFGLDDDGVPFAYKKGVTSALRRLAPLGLSTTMVWTANLRTLRHVVTMRTEPAAEEEIRLVFGMVAEIMLQECPILFGDFEVNDQGTWIPQHRKV